MNISHTKNIGWIDLLRIIACFLVLVSHSCDPFVAQSDTNNMAFLNGVFIGSLVRPCVPLFVMMTGVLLLPVKMEMIDFYRKRLKRLIIPLIFWSLALPVLFYIYVAHIHTHTTNLLILGSDHTLRTLPQKLYSFIFNFNFDTVPLWYLYMLIGLYFIMPIVSVWLEKATKKQLKLILGLWLISLCLSYVKMVAPSLGFQGYVGNMDIWGGCTWNVYHSFYYVSGFIGYLLLAYYLTKYPIQWNWRKMFVILLPMFIVGFLITFFGYLAMQKYSPGNYANLEIIWYFCGINVFMMTLPVFVFVQRANIPSKKWLSQLAGLTFGIYLCHYVFITIFYDVFDFSQCLFAVRILLMAIAAFVVSGFLVAVLKKNKLTSCLVK